MSNVKGKGQRLIPEELLKYLEALKNKYPDAVDLVEANPTLEGGEDSLSSVLINGTKYAVGGGSEVHLYEHCIYMEKENVHINLVIYTDNDTPFNTTSLLEFLKAKGFTTNTKFYSANGYYDSGRVILGIGYYGPTSYYISWEEIDNNALIHNSGSSTFNAFILTDTIIQVF